MRQLTLLLLLVAGSAFVAKADNYCTEPEKDVDYFGGDLSNAPGKDAKVCCDLCLKTKGCAVYTWSDYQGGTCWLKSNTGTRTVSKGRISAVVAANAECGKTFPNTDFYGDDIGNAAGQYKDCCAACKKLDGCKAWTWVDYRGGTCFLKKGTGNKVPKDGAVSGLLDDVPQECVIEKDYDYYGSDLKNVKAKAFGECCNHCHATPNCKAWTWSDYEGGMCWLKTSQGARMKAPGKVSGYPKGIPEPQCELWDGMDIIDHDIGNKMAKKEECCDLCKGFKGCVAFAWNDYQGGTCWFKSAVGTKIPKAGTVAGKLKGTPELEICKGKCLRGNYGPNGWAVAPNAPPCWIPEAGGYFSCFDYVNGKCPWSQETDCKFTRRLRV